MALVKFIVRIVVVVALAVFAGACASFRPLTPMEIQRNTGILCQDPALVSTVEVSQSVARTYRTRSHSRFTIENRTNEFVYIKRLAGGEEPVVVKNFCPHGSITLWEPLDTYLVGDTMPVEYTAFLPSGKEVASTRSGAVIVTACRYNGCQKEFVATWEIRPRQ